MRIRDPGRKFLSITYISVLVTVIDSSGSPLSGRRVLVYKKTAPLVPIVDEVSDSNGEVSDTVVGNANDNFFIVAIGEDDEDVFASGNYTGTVI